MIASLITMVFLATAVGAVTASVFALRADANAKRADANARQSVIDRDKAIAAELEGRQKLFEAYLSDARANRMSHRSGQRFRTLERVRQAVELGRELQMPQERFDELRQIAVTALAMPDMVPHYLGEQPRNSSVTDISDDLSRAIFWEEDAKQHVIRAVSNGAEICRLPPVERETRVFFSPDGLHIIRLDNGLQDSFVELWKIENSKPLLVRKDRLALSGHYLPLVFRPDGRVLALVSTSETLLVWDVMTGAQVHRSQSPGMPQRLVVALHPTRPLIACCSYSTTNVYVRDYQTGEVVQTIDPPWQGGSSSLAWHPSGSRLYVAAGDTNAVQEYRFNTNVRMLSPARLLHTAERGGVRISINASGDLLASIGWGYVAGILDLETGRMLFQSQQIKPVQNFRFSADGRSLVGIWGLPRGSPSYGVLDVGQAREVRTIALDTPGGGRPVIHPGGRLAVIPQGDRFTFVDVDALRELAIVKHGGSSGVNCAFDGLGRLYSNSLEGAFRWPVHFQGDLVSIGYPERLPLRGGDKEIATSADGCTIAQAQFEGYGQLENAGGWLSMSDRPYDPQHLLMPGTGADKAAVSSDGRWTCFGTHTGLSRVYDTRSCALVWEDTQSRIGSPESNGARFTNDGRWLVGNWGACPIGDWGNPVVLDQSRTASLNDVSPDSRTALLSTTEGYARLVEIATGRELVRIEAPEGGLGAAAFSRDGTRLLEPSSHGLRIWDLRRIRARLAELGLDWDATPYPPETEDNHGAPPPLHLTILGGELLSDPAKLAEYDRSVTLLRLLANPLDSQAHLETARRLMDANDCNKALVHLRVAALTRPESYPVRMNIAQCLMKLDRAAEAIPEFTIAVKARQEDYRARYQRSRAYRKLGRHAEAAEDLTAVLAQFPEDAELHEQRAGCDAKLGDKAREAADRAAADRYLPRSAQGLNQRAWNLLTGPPGNRDNARALELIQKAVKVEPNEAMFLNTLGVALYRNARFTEAIATLEKSLAAGQGKWDAFDLFFLAMCHARVGDPAKAKAAFNRAVAWVGQKKDLPGQYAAELAQFRQEAEKVLKSPRHAR